VESGLTPGTLLEVDFWERGCERDRELLAWMWDDDAKVQWWVWLIPAFIGAALAFGGEDVLPRLLLPIGFAVMAVIRLIARRKADHLRGRSEME
jgi:hypothetical protein